MAIVKRTERAMTTAMCGVKFIETRSGYQFMDLLSLEETLNKPGKANEMGMF